MARPADAPVPPFGATRDGVTGLVPEARLLPGDLVPVGKYGVTEAQVDAWVVELTDVVAMTLDGWERLDNTPVLATAADGTVLTVLVEGDRDRLLGSARTVVHNGAASYLEAARHPERAAVNDTSYAAVLWARYTDGLTRLADWLTARLADLEAGDTPEPVVGELAGGTAYSFPAPLFGDLLPF